MKRLLSSRLTSTAAFLFGVLPFPAMALQFSVVDIGKDTTVADINNTGQVAGTGTNGPSQEAFIFNNSNKTFLGSLTPNAGSSAAAINDRGQVVGTSSIQDVLSPQAPNQLVSTPFIFDNGTMKSLQQTNIPSVAGLLPSTGSGINEDGTIIGNRTTRQNVDRQNGFVTTATGAATGSIDSPSNNFNNINNKGLIVGQQNQLIAQTESEPFRATLFNQSLQATDLGTLGGASSTATKINNLDQVIGNADTVAGASHAFLITDIQQISMRDLGTLGGVNSSANGINDSSIVVGSSALTTGTNEHAFLFIDNQLIDLNTLIASNSGWELLTAVDINNLGQIIGQGIVGGETHSFLLNPIGALTTTPGSGGEVPIPEPSTIVLLGSGLLGLAIMLKKKRSA